MKTLFFFLLFAGAFGATTWAQVRLQTAPKVMSRPAQRPSDSVQQQKPSNPLQDIIRKNHDTNVKAYIKGRVFELTGQTITGQDSLFCEGFVYTKVKKLDSADVIHLQKLFTDSTLIEERGYVVSAPFTPQLGLELEDPFGNIETYFFMFDSHEQGTWQLKGFVDRAFVTKDALTQLTKLHQEYFGQQKAPCQMRVETLKPSKKPYSTLNTKKQ